MSKRILMFGAAIAVLVTAFLVILRILEVITTEDAGRTLLKTLAIVTVCATSLVLMRTLLRIGKGG